MPIFTTQQLAGITGGELTGAGDLTITGVEQIDRAQPGQLTFIGNEKYARLWPQSGASAALVTRSIAGQLPPVENRRVLILVNNADLAMAQVLELFSPPPPIGGLTATPAPVAAADRFVHPSAVVDPTARLGAGARIGANCVIGPRVVIGDRTVLYPNVVVLDDTTLGRDCVLWPGVIVRDRCTIGDRCIFHANVSVGADGFGYRPSPEGRGLVKIPQIGTVEIGNDVELGACTCVDRSKFSATVIGDGCKIDNLCQIAHNCRLGRSVIMAGNVGLAGSVTIGDGVMFGGGCGVADHVTIGAGAVVMAQSGVMRDVEPGEKVGGLPARDIRTAFKEVAALAKLPDLLRELKRKSE